MKVELCNTKAALDRSPTSADYKGLLWSAWAKADFRCAGEVVSSRRISRSSGGHDGALPLSLACHTVTDHQVE